jgi:hypothetical protein
MPVDSKGLSFISVIKNPSQAIIPAIPIVVKYFICDIFQNIDY